MTDSDNANETELTIARDHQQGAVVVETDSHEQRLAPSAARAMAKGMEMGSRTPLMSTEAAQRVAEELNRAADDVEGA